MGLGLMMIKRSSWIQGVKNHIEAFKCRVQLCPLYSSLILKTKVFHIGYHRQLRLSIESPPVFRCRISIIIFLAVSSCLE